jgi:iron-sulfur cluster protein
LKNEFPVQYPRVVFEDRKPVPNLMISLNSIKESPGEGGESIIHNLDRRFFLPFTNAVQLLQIRNIIFMGDNAPAHPYFSEALKIFKGKVENLVVWLKPGQGLEKCAEIANYCDAVYYQLGPFSDLDTPGVKKLFDQLREDVEAIRKNAVSSPPPINANFYLSGGTLFNIGKVISLAESACLDHVDFYPANCFISPEGERLSSPLNPDLLPDTVKLQELYENFWEMLEEKHFRSWLFDLRITRRQLERVVAYFRAASGRAVFVPPHCRAPKVAYYISPDGTVKCCPYQKDIGNLWKNLLVETGMTLTVREFRSHINLARNPICPTCPGAFPHVLWPCR